MRVNIPPVTRILLLLLAFLSIANRAASYGPQLAALLDGSAQRLWKAPYLDCLPNHSIYYPWVLVTAALVEYNIVLLLITGATIFYGGRYLERAWSSAEFAKFVLVVALASNTLTALCWWLIYLGGDRHIMYAERRRTDSR